MPRNRNTRRPGPSLELRMKWKELRNKRDSCRAAELRELRKAVGKRKLKKIRDKLKSKRLGKSKKSKKTKKAKRTKKAQRGGGCNVGTVQIPGFNVGPVSQGSGPSIEGISLPARRGTVYKNCTNGGQGPNHAMTGGRK